MKFLTALVLIATLAGCGAPSLPDPRVVRNPAPAELMEPAPPLSTIPN